MTVQLALQPEPTPPLSQASVPPMTPSPHTVWQTLGKLLQT